ncbi:response regulator transcription factor [Vibrio sp. 404]|uniref:Response regulator transcription factor n=1 Tax=Vibrio marinisediminis TaxID=2758441 RepID=A0A7W2FPA8_9VIBR|nr:response regulator transcription factor [Vibrio marinisediminis]MBA5761735.1 response regulator transcription factor [Vibrio marinisediminis]
MSCNILLVEDDHAIAQLTKMYLEAEGYRVSAIESGLNATEEIRRSQPDLVILDLMLPEKSGVDICREVREFYQGMIIILTASEDEMSEVSLLKLGADDYITKPVRGHILVARIEALMRRYRSHMLTPEPRSISQAYGIVIDNESNIAHYQQRPIDITQSEFEILQVLIDHSGTVVSREHCCQVARGIEYNANDRSIDMRISSLRKKLILADVSSVTIKTVRNKGYKLVGRQSEN